MLRMPTKSLDSLAVKNSIKKLNINDIGRAFAKCNGFRFKNCLAVSQIFGRETSFSLNGMYRKENLTVI